MYQWPPHTAGPSTPSSAVAQSPTCSSGGRGTPSRRSWPAPRSSGSSSSVLGTASRRSSPMPSSSSSSSSSSGPSPTRYSTAPAGGFDTSEYLMERLIIYDVCARSNMSHSRFWCLEWIGLSDDFLADTMLEVFGGSSTSESRPSSAARSWAKGASCAASSFEDACYWSNLVEEHGESGIVSLVPLCSLTSELRLGTEGLSRSGADHVQQRSFRRRPDQTNDARLLLLLLHVFIDLVLPQGEI